MVNGRASAHDRRFYRNGGGAWVSLAGVAGCGWLWLTWLFSIGEVQTDAAAKPQNPMKELVIKKLCINICVGESGDRLTRAAKVCRSVGR